MELNLDWDRIGRNKQEAFFDKTVSYENAELEVYIHAIKTEDYEVNDCDIFVVDCNIEVIEIFDDEGNTLEKEDSACSQIELNFKKDLTIK